MAAAVAMAFALSACSPGVGSPTSKTSQSSNDAMQASYNPQPYENLKDGGELKLPLAEITENLNKFHGSSTAYTSTLWRWYNPVLLAYSPAGDEVQIDKDYLVSIKDEVKDNKTVVTYTINDKAVFNDGTPIDWTAFEATWKGNKDDEGYVSNSTDGFRLIESVTKGASDKVAVVTFKQAFPWWKGLFDMLLHPKVNSADVYNNGYVGGTLASAHPEWGAGPYKLESLDTQAGVVTFVKNEKWWGQPGKLDKVTYTVMDSQASLNAFKNGQVDMIAAGTKDRLEQVKAMQGVDIRRGSAVSNALMTLNSASAVLKEVGVRQAIMTAVNRKELQDVVFAGLDYTEKEPGSFADFPFQPGYQDSFRKVIPESSAAAAGKLLETAGYAKGSDGYYAKGGQVLSLNFVYFGDNPVSKARSQVLQKQMQAAGIKLELVNKPLSDFGKVMKEKSWDAIISGFLSSDPYGMAYICQVYCSDSQLNKSGTGNESVDKMVKAAEAAGTLEESSKLGYEAEVEGLKTFGIMPLYNGPDIYAAKKGLANMGASVFYLAPKNLIGWQK